MALANSIGTGIADDKVIYAYVPKLIKYFLGEDAILPNVNTYLPSEPLDRKFVLENIEKLVVKAANEAGGYGMLIGPRATRAELAAFAQRILADPKGYIAQPTLDLSTVPTLGGEAVVQRHADFRPYCLVGRQMRLAPGGLTRVALTEGSLVVNSSQGGGVKDTWVLRD